MPKVKGAKPVWQAATRPNGLLLSQATILNSEGFLKVMKRVAKKDLLGYI